MLDNDLCFTSYTFKHSLRISTWRKKNYFMFREQRTDNTVSALLPFTKALPERKRKLNAVAAKFPNNISSLKRAARKKYLTNRVLEMPPRQQFLSFFRFSPYRSILSKCTTPHNCQYRRFRYSVECRANELKHERES